MRRRGVWLFIVALAVAIGVLLLRGSRQERSSPSDGSPANSDQLGSRAPQANFFSEIDADVPESPIRFADVTGNSGIDFHYHGGPGPNRYMTEQNGGGVAIADFDGDDVPDVFFVNGSDFDRPAVQIGASQKLYRGLGDLRYDDVTLAAGLRAYGFGMGCAAADYDNDGFIDLLVTAYGGNRLWQNHGDGSFAEVVFDPAARPTGWSTSAAFADFDGDGNLDLYVANYVEWSRDDPPCYTQHQSPVRITCGPLGRTGQPDRIYRNAGDGSFEDVSTSSGVDKIAGKGLGVVVADFDDDGRLDVYVANDTTENLLWRNLGGMRFENVALAWGAALGSEGVARSGMGVACADYNRDSKFDLFVTNFEGEPNSLFENIGAGGFVPRNSECGLDAASRPMLGFGTVFADFDADGYSDLFVANGHVWDLTSLGLGYQYAMHPQVFRNDSGTRFRDVSETAGPYFREKWLGRGTACGDLDADGDPDLVVTHLLRPATLLRNDSTAPSRQLSVQFTGRHSARQPLGARVKCAVGSLRFAFRVPAGDSFQSCSEQRVLIPTGDAPQVDWIQLTWPDGARETWKALPSAGRVTLVEGTGMRKGR